VEGGVSRSKKMMKGVVGCNMNYTYNTYNTQIQITDNHRLSSSELSYVTGQL